jgi:hypothetical protein
LNKAEWRLQPRFIKWLITSAFLLLAADRRTAWPDREPMPTRVVELRLEPLGIARQAGGGAKVTGAWRMSADDPRLFGLSALALLGDGRFQALSDSGVLVTFPRPGAGNRAEISDLPSGPGFPTFKRSRDSESMALDADSEGRLVAFEYYHSLWRFDRDGGARVLPVILPSISWKVNSGIEAIVKDPADGMTLLIHEGGREVLRLTGSVIPEPRRLSGATGGIADAVRLPDGRVVVAVREVGLLGLTNRLAWLERTGDNYRLRNFATLPLGAFDNVEGLAAEARRGGGALLWAVTDNDDWRRTLLVRIELDARKAPAEAGA